MGRGKFKGKPEFSKPEDILAGTSTRPRTFRKIAAEHEMEEEEVSLIRNPKKVPVMKSLNLTDNDLLS